MIMTPKRSVWSFIWPALILITLAGLLHLLFDTLLSPLSSDYNNETRYSAETRFRESPTAGWIASPLIARRVDQTLTISGKTSIIQGEIHWTTEDGTPTYETITIYGVDRRTRMNLPGYGDTERTGQFLFPQHVQPTTYHLWDPYYLGPRTATFRNVEEVEGLTVYIFDFIAENTDDTNGFTFLPDVPERYSVHSDGQGTLWIEPVSGIVVDLADKGVSYFVDVNTGQRVADMYHWSARYTTETQAEQLELARAAHTRHLFLELWLPGGLLLAGLLWLGISLWRHRA